MLNPEKTLSNTDKLEMTLAELTPSEATFGGSIYAVEEVRSDEKIAEDFEQTPDYTRGEERSDAKLLEMTFIDMVERGDWFQEDKLYGDDPDFLALATTPTAKVDDYFNHIDMIGVVNNETTGHEALPFAIDLTYNTNREKLRRKLSWKHVYGKAEAAPREGSEFGESHTERDGTGSEIATTRALPLKLRKGLKIPGFASAKYFEDKNNPYDPMLDKGRITIMPRFIVGYSTELADTLAAGRPTAEYRQHYGERAYAKRQEEFSRAEKRAKWCTLFECAEQAEDIARMMSKLDVGQTRWMDKSELAVARKQIGAMEEYFHKAVEAAKEEAQGDAEEEAAMDYANRDDVRRAISERSSEVYGQI